MTLPPGYTSKAGADEIKAAMNGQPNSPERIRLYTPAELAALPEPSWLVEPFIPEQALVVLFGPSSTYKSFVAVDWGGRVPGVVVYFSAEGSPQRFGARVTAWEQAAGRSSDILCHPYAIDALLTATTRSGRPSPTSSGRFASSLSIRRRGTLQAPTRTAHRTPAASSVSSTNSRPSSAVRCSV